MSIVLLVNVFHLVSKFYFLWRQTKALSSDSMFKVIIWSLAFPEILKLDMTLVLAVVFIFIILIILVSRFKFILFFNLKGKYTFKITKICLLHIQYIVIYTTDKLFILVIIDYKSSDFPDLMLKAPGHLYMRWNI